LKTPGLSATRPTFDNSIPFGALNHSFRYVDKRDATKDYEFVRMLRSIRDFNPDVSKALDNIVTLCNPGYDIKVYKYTRTDDDKPRPDKTGQQIVEQFAARCFSEYSGAFDFIEGADDNFPGLNALINMVHLVAYTQGAFAAEVQLTGDLSDIIDVYPVDPQYIDFYLEEGIERWCPGILLGGSFFPLNQTLFRYIPKDPDVNQPQGRSPIMSALDVVYFQQQVMRDLQAVAHQSNVPRLDIKVIEEAVDKALKETRPDLLAIGQEQNRQTFLNSYLTDIQALLATMKADDAFVHWDSVEAQYITPKSVGIDIKDLISTIDKSIVSATKQLPILLGRNEGATTTHATVQWQVYILQIKAFQNLSHAIVTWLFNLLLRIHGRNSYVVFEYKKHKTTDDFLDAQAMNMNAATYKLMVDNGWITNDEAALEMVGHAAVGEPIANPTPQQGIPGKPPNTIIDGSVKAESN